MSPLCPQWLSGAQRELDTCLDWPATRACLLRQCAIVGLDQLDFERSIDDIIVSGPLPPECKEWIECLVHAGKAHLDRQEAKFLQLKEEALGMTHDAVVITDVSGSILYANRAFQVLTGYDPKEVVGKNPRVLKSSRNEPALFTDLWTTITMGQTWCGQLYNRRKDGSEYIEEMVISPIMDRYGAITHYVAVKDDVTEKVELARSAVSNRERYQVLFDGSAVPMLVIDPNNGQFVDANKSALWFYGFDRKTFLSKRISDVNFEKSIMQIAGALDRVLTGSLRELTTVHRFRDGTEHPVEIRACPITIDGRKLIFAIVLDIAERVRIQSALESTGNKQRAILSAIPSPLVAVDDAGMVTDWNDHAEDIFGINHLDAVTRSLADLKLPLSDEDSMALVQSLEVGGQGSVGDCRFTDPNGRTRRLSLLITNIDDPVGAHKGAVILGLDTTEQMEEEARKSQAQKLESIGQLAAGIAHEINTPIQYVGDNLRFLKEACADLERLQDLEEALLALAAENADQAMLNRLNELIKVREEIDLDFLLQEFGPACDQGLEGVSRVAGIVAAMREFSHPDDKGMGKADLNQGIINTTVVAKNEYKYVADLELDLAKDLPLVECNVGSLNQVWLNMLVNAAHAIAETVDQDKGERGTIYIRTAHEANDVVVTIEDNGPGVPESIRQKIFDPFFTTKDVGKGTGQGLNLAHKCICGQHGGQIKVTDNSPHGAKFVVRLPLVPNELAHEVAT